MITINDKNGLQLIKTEFQQQNQTQQQIKTEILKNFTSNQQPQTQNMNLLATYNENEIKIYDLTAQNLKITFQDSQIQKINFSPSNRFLIIKTQQNNNLYEISDDKLQLITDDFPQTYTFSHKDHLIFTQNKSFLEMFKICDQKMIFIDKIQIFMKKYGEVALNAENNLISVSAIPQKQIQGFCDFYTVQINQSAIESIQDIESSQYMKIVKLYSFIVQQASYIDIQLCAEQKQQYAIVQIYGQFGGASYYGSKRLILVDLCRQRQLQIVKASLNDWTLMNYDNTYGTKLLITSEKTPSQIKVTYITPQPSSNSLIIKTEEIQGYKNLYINKISAIQNICLLRGEASMDGHIYLAIVKNGKFQIVKSLNLHYITNVYLTKQFIMLTTQYPRYTIDNQIKFYNYELQELNTLQYDKLSFVQTYNQDEQNNSIQTNEKYTSIKVNNEIFDKLKQLPIYQEASEKKAEVFVPSCVQNQQQKAQQTQKACRSSSGWW